MATTSRRPRLPPMPTFKPPPLPDTDEFVRPPRSSRTPSPAAPRLSQSEEPAPLQQRISDKFLTVPQSAKAHATEVTKPKLSPTVPRDEPKLAHRVVDEDEPISSQNVVSKDEPAKKPTPQALKKPFKALMNQRASAFNLTRLSPTLVFATGSSTLRSMRLDELQVRLIIHACTAEDLEGGGAVPNLQEVVPFKTIILNENKDNEAEIEKYFHQAADLISCNKEGVVMVHAPESGIFRKGSSPNDTRRGDGFAAALCAAYFIKHDGHTAQKALEIIKSRRPEAKPSTSLVLQLMDFEEKIGPTSKNGAICSKVGVKNSTGRPK